MEDSDNQTSNSKPWLWKKGQSGNLMGRPKGKTMKEYAKQYLERMTDDERDEWLEGLGKDKIWEMAEGKARQDTYVEGDIKVEGVVVLPSKESNNEGTLETPTETGTGS